MKHLRSFLYLIFFLSSTAAFAQQGTASLTGQVKDSSGAAVPGAQVVVSDPERGLKTTVVTDAHGDYIIPQLAPSDHYQIEVSRQGFKTTQMNVALQVAQAAKIDLTMSVGDVVDRITVTGEAPQIDTQTSALGQVITGDTVSDLPLNGRSTFRLIALTPGVTFSPSAYGQFGDVPVNSTFDTNFSINGGRAQSNEVLIDGVPTSAGFFDQITTLPIVDETQEFKVQSNNLSAQYGRYSGGVINVTTKAGTNNFHGDVFEFARNSVFDANEWFQKRAGLPNVPFSMNQFGGIVGGPVRIPKLYNGRDKTFIFFAYQGTRRIRGNTTTLSVPTAAERNGDFSAVPTPIWNPFTSNLAVTNGGDIRQPFAGNKIDPALFDPVAVNMIKYYPLPNTGAANAVTNNYISNAPLRVSQNIFSGRIDQNVTQKYHLAGRYEYTNSDLNQPNTYGNIATTGAGAVGLTNFTNQSFALNNIYQFNDKFLINFNYGYARWYQARQTLSYGFDNSTLGFPAQFTKAITIPMFPGVTIGGGYSGFANQSYLNNGNDSHAILISATKILGKQTLTFGVDGRVHRINFLNVSNSAGLFGFAIAQTQEFKKSGSTITAVQKTGDAFASFLLGVGNSGSVPIGSGVEMQDYYAAIYLQDDIRVTQNLTVNLGVRYDHESPYNDRHNELNYFDPGVASPARNASFPALNGGLVFVNTNGVGRTPYTTQLKNFAPRLGFAFSPNTLMSVRGGYGISYAPLEIASNAVGFSPSLGFASSTSWNFSSDGYTPANLLRNPYPQGFVAPTGTSLGAATQLGQAIMVWNQHPKQPYAQQWNLDVQQQFPGGVLLDAGYAGSRGEHLTGVFDLNTLDPKYLPLNGALNALVPNPFQSFVSIGALSQPTVTQRQLLLPFPQFGSVQEVNNPYGWSNYDAAQIKLTKRMRNGLQFLGAFTWSKLISNINAQNAPIGTTNNTVVQDYYNLPAEKAISELDQPRNFVLNTVYELPFGNKKRYFGNVGHGLNKLVGGWKITGIWTEQAGFPLTFTAPGVGVGAGARPDPVIGQNSAISGSRSNQDIVKQYFNTAAFKTPDPYHTGSIRRSDAAVRGPGVQNLDATLQKDLYFGGSIRAEIRAEFFNVTNTPHFSMPNTTVQNANFGMITSTIPSPPGREMQFAGKLYF